MTPTAGRADGAGGVGPARGVGEPASRRRPWLVLVAMCLPLLAQSLDVSGIGLLLPSIGADLDAGPAALGWVMNANALAFGALLVTFGWLADRHGPRRLLLAGVAGFGVASALCAVAPATGWLVAARAVQGMASAACFTTSLAVVMDTFDERRRPAAIGVWGAVSGAGSAFGPLLAGSLAATAGWRWFFVVNAPLCLLAVPAIAGLVPGRAGAAATTPATTATGPALGASRPPVPALVALAVGFVAVSLAVGGSGGAASAAARVLPAVTAAGAAALLVRERRRGRPAVDPAALRGPWSHGALVTGFTSTWAFGVVLVLVSAELQRVRGEGPLAAGVVFLAYSGAFAVAGFANGRLVPRLGTGTTMVVAMAASTVGVGWLAAIGPDVALVWLVAALVVAGFAQGLAFDASTTASLAGIDPAAAGEATGALQTLRLLGSVVGVALSSSIVAAAGTDATTTAVSDAQRTGLLIAAAVSGLGTVAVAALRPRHRTADGSAVPAVGNPAGGGGRG